MGKRITRIILYVICATVVLAGAFLLNQVFSPEIQYQINRPDEEIVIEVIESTTEFNEDRLIIPSIGVDMEIGAEESYLDIGGWVQRFDDNSLPNLVAIHRFGWTTLSTEQKIKQTLYHVNKLEKGDVVFIIWDGNRYKYSVQEVVEGLNNPSSEYLTIYTCKWYSSRQRIFVVLDPS